ncbi:MAG: PEFG-CTERM sorting domain-containing protein [Nitrososphaera sp.]
MDRWSANRNFTYALLLTLFGSIFTSVLTFQPSYSSHTNIILDLSRIDTDRYNPGDSVRISGEIDNVDSNVDEVTITVDGPGEHEVQDEPLDGSDFDFEYDIPADADDGIYTIEVEYDGESVFTYFFIDENDDDITVETDSDFYGPGDNVDISGTVDQPNLELDAVEITVLDPENDEKVNGHEEELDGDDFRYDFDLDNDEDLHGRYAVEVVYDNDEGFFIFEVEEDGGSSDFVSAELSKTSYKRGEEVIVTGEIAEDDVDLAEVLITVDDPSGDEIFDDSVRPESDGSFEFDFSIKDDAPTGQYEVTLSYEGYDDEVLTFSVTTGTTTGGTTGIGSGSDRGLTAKINKVSFLAGESITVTGVVPSIVKDELITIGIFEPDGTFTKVQAFPEPDSDKEYSATLRLPSWLEVEDDYKIVIGYDGRDVELEFDITGKSDDASEGPITVETDKERYSAGSTVKITGKIAEDIFTGGQMVIQVENAADARYRYDLVAPSDDGSYSYSMPVGGPLAVSGEWTVTAFYNQQKAETTFELTGGAGARPTFSLKVEDQTYPIEYEVTDGSINSMFVKPAEKKLVVSIDTEEDGVLTIVLPRHVIDAVEGGLDVKYVVATTDIDTGSDSAANIIESETSGESRTLVIEYEAGTDLIEILGTTVVPEFGIYSAIILAAAILGIIAVTARFSNRFRTMQR